MKQTRKYLSQEGLLNTVKQLAASVPSSKSFTPRTTKPIRLADCIMSGLAMFSLKFPSLLKFETEYRESSAIQHNLRTLFGVEQVPSDTYLRERLDGDRSKSAYLPYKLRDQSYRQAACGIKISQRAV